MNNIEERTSEKNTFIGTGDGTETLIEIENKYDYVFIHADNLNAEACQWVFHWEDNKWNLEGIDVYAGDYEYYIFPDGTVIDDSNMYDRWYDEPLKNNELYIKSLLEDYTPNDLSHPWNWNKVSWKH